MKIFMILYNPTGYNTIIPLMEDISEEVINYIKLNKQTKYLIPNTNTNKDTNNKDTYSISSYNSSADGLRGNYDDFYNLININTGKQTIISPNEDKIKNFCAYINRLTN